MSFKIFLSGSVPKGDNEKNQWTDWKLDYKQILSKIDNIEFVEDNAKKDETKPFLIFGHDANMVKMSNLVIINANKEIGRGIGVGTAHEIMIAKYFSIPVVTVLPKDTHHRRSNVVWDGKTISDWISPFLLSTSDVVAESVYDSIPWIKEYIEKPENKKIKNIGIVDEAIAEYLKDVNNREG